MIRFFGGIHLPGTAGFIDVQGGIINFLKQDAQLASSVSLIADYVEQDYKNFPYVTVSYGEFSEFGTDDSNGHDVDITISVWSRHKGNKEAAQIQELIYDILHRATLSLNGFRLVNIYQTLANIERDPDGLTRQGIQEFNLLLVRLQ